MIDNYYDVLIAGKGTVGSTLGKIIMEANLYNIEYDDPPQGIIPQEYVPDIIHITFPFINIDQFFQGIIQIIERYVLKHAQLRETSELARPLVIIESSILPQVLPLISNKYKDVCYLVYSPVRASENNMGEELPKYQKYFAPMGNIEDADKISKLMKEYLTSIKLQYKEFTSAESLALGKLVAVSWYTMNIAFVQLIHQICIDQGYLFEEAYTLFSKNETIGHKYDFNSKKADYLMERPIFFPGIIGGKCCIQDVDLMKQGKLGNDQLWDWIKQTNEQEKKILQDVFLEQKLKDDRDCNIMM